MTCPATVQAFDYTEFPVNGIVFWIIKVQFGSDKQSQNLSIPI